MATASGSCFAAFVACCRCWKRKTVTPAATAATITIKAVSLRPVLRMILRSTSPSSLIPSSVISNAHAQTTAMGKPTMVSRTTSLTTQLGILKKEDLCCNLDEQPGYYKVGHCDAVNTTSFQL